MVSDSSGYRSLLPPLADAPPASAPGPGGSGPDRRDGAVYALDEDLVTAVDVALATGRPLLLRGLPGSGKSSLAPFLARNLGWRYYEHVVTSRTRATDLLYTYDTVRRLGDASSRQAGDPVLDDHAYITPGVLWWTFNRPSAMRRGARATRPGVGPAPEPFATMNLTRSPAAAVVLLDEIDKADPDVPNGLLVPLGSTQFEIAETGTQVELAGTAPAGRSGPASYLVVMTTNEERELPPAFLRRCIVHELASPDRARLIDIGRRHLRWRIGQVGPLDERLLDAVAERMVQLRTRTAASGRREPSTAEYLDAVVTCQALGIDASSPLWSRIERLVMSKDGAVGQRQSP